MTTDHAALAVDLMETAETHRDRLRMEYDATRHKDPVAIARARDDLRHTLTVAKLHTNLAQVQALREQTAALEDVRGEIAALCQDLSGEPPSHRPGLALVGGVAGVQNGERCPACVQEHRPVCTHRGDLAKVDS